MVAPLVSAVRAAYSAVLEPVGRVKTGWQIAALVGSVATYHLWKGFLATQNTPSCVQRVYFGVTVMHCKTAPVIGVIAVLFMGITAIALIQATRPSMAMWGRISRVGE